MIRSLAVLAMLVEFNSYAALKHKAHMLALCATEDGQYFILVAETLGTSPIQKRQIFATIKDENGIYVASHFGEVSPGQSKKYGGVRYIDKATSGAEFMLDAPSETAPGFQIHALIRRGDRIVTISDTNMQCSAYNRQLPGR